MELEEDPFLARALQTTKYQADPELLHRYYCSEGGFQHEEPGFSTWIPYTACPQGERRHYTSPWIPPLSRTQMLLCAEHIREYKEELIADARAKETERRRRKTPTTYY